MATKYSQLITTSGLLMFALHSLTSCGAQEKSPPATSQTPVQCEKRTDTATPPPFAMAPRRQLAGGKAETYETTPGFQRPKPVCPEGQVPVLREISPNRPGFEKKATRCCVRAPLAGPHDFSNLMRFTVHRRAGSAHYPYPRTAREFLTMMADASITGRQDSSRMLTAGA